MSAFTGPRGRLVLCAPAAAVAVTVVLASPAAAASPPSGASTGRPLSVDRSAAASDVVDVKFRDDSDLELRGNHFVGTGADEVNSILGRRSMRQASHLLRGHDATRLRQQYRDLKAAGHDVADMSRYYRFVVDDSRAAAEALGAVAAVQDAYPEPLPARDPTADFTSQQGYRQAAPTGIGAGAEATWPNGDGTGVTIVDLEYSWNTAHEDLSKARLAGALLSYGAPVDPFANDNHGTAVLGELVADGNDFGVTGLVPGAGLKMTNAYSSTYGYDPAGAMLQAGQGMVAGDVMELEQQAYGPQNAFVPLEWIPSVYDAIRTLVAKGIVVMEAGGNGSQNLDDTSLYGTKFPSGKADSGAVVVGAGQACAQATPLRSRLSFSNYGRRVNVQGWGDCVTTTGYGDLFAGTPNSLYSSYFSGTSSATPIATSAAASLSAVYKGLNGVPAPPAFIRKTLMNTGTAQIVPNDGSAPGHIGPLPNLAKALKRADLTPPTAPTDVQATLNRNNKVVLTWTAATDNAGVARYEIWRDGVLWRKVTPTRATDTSVAPGTSYEYQVRAIDNADHVSDFSSPVTITTR